LFGNVLKFNPSPDFLTRPEICQNNRKLCSSASVGHCLNIWLT